ncbi:TIGR03086 family metal-binding protein [Nocardia suismassiliense]|uniref:TIGR03086 family metal-binding protein n=1 Tax=Nocardia suismassiliense TaxID=2077092 RepID=UPI000D1E7A4A|nr:TIGR03086 family metal-binding protein [Nocardia suismassiliense]
MIDLKPACHAMIELLLGTSDDQLARPTPCSEYNVAQLIGHIDEVAQAFAAIARKDTGGAAAPDRGADHRRTGAASVRLLGQAWGDPAAWQGATELRAGLELPNELWGKIALTEMVVHGWDLAVATGRPFALPTATLQACFDHVADFVPNAPLPELWGPAVETSDNAPLIDRTVAITGRNPRWAETALRG